MTQRLTLTDDTGTVLAQVEGEDPELVHDLPTGDYTLEAEELDEGGAEPEPTHSDYLAPDGTTWATYLATAIAEWIDSPNRTSHSPRQALRNWDAAGRPER